MQSPKRIGKYVIVLALVTTLFLGSCLENTKTPVNNTAIPGPQPTPTSFLYPEVPAAFTGEIPPVEEELAQIDKALNGSISSSIAYNLPTDMNLDDTVTIELLLNPSLSEGKLVEQVREIGYLYHGQVEITPRMKAEILPQDQDSFSNPVHSR